MEGLPDQGRRPLQAYDPRRRRVHPPLPDPCPAQRLSPHPSLRPFRQCQPGEQYCIGPPAPRRTRPGPVEPGARRRRKWSRRPRLECLSLLRRADDHHRDLRTRLPAPPVAPTVNRPRQFMTNTLVSPTPAAPPVRHRDLAGGAHPQPTATASAAFARENPNPTARHHPSHGTQTDQDHPPATHAPGVPVRNPTSDSEPRVKSP